MSEGNAVVARNVRLLREQRGLSLADHVYGSGVIENYPVRISRGLEGAGKPSEPHPVGTLEHLYVISGRVRVGPADAPVDLSAGDFVRYPGDRPHVLLWGRDRAR
ncbi:cupin domain-containing protein [Streptomyces sp. NPDC049687]|uniref:cupin domain-containing protein n=1 Tax=Streptomyces sp. NPDC049687 TaxID=3365596 RepID=UPI0037B8A2F5